jgi:ParB/RepB/Spo0J family partition protein
MESLTVSLSEIASNPDNVRKTFDEKSIAELGADIKQNGLIDALVVRRNDNGSKVPFTLVGGERRWRALKAIGADSVRIVVIPVGKSEKDVDILQLCHNVDREALTTYEEAQGYARLVERYKISGVEIGKHMGRSSGYVNKLLKPFSQLHPKVKDAWKVGHISATVVNLGKLVEKFAPDDQLEAWKNLCEYGAFEAPEAEASDEGDDGTGDDGDADPPAKKAFAVKPALVLERYGYVKRSIGTSQKNDEAWCFAVVQYLVGKRQLPPEGIEVPAPVEKGPRKTINRRAKGEV